MITIIDFLIRHVNWQNFLIFFSASAVPVFIWLLICLKFDRSAPEPKKQILKIFLLGCLVTVFIIPIAGVFTRLTRQFTNSNGILVIFILSFLVDGLIEELSKYFTLRASIYYSIYFDELRDGFVYGMTIGLGLAFVENILYGFISGDLIAGLGNILLRGVTSTLMHFLSGGIIGYYLGLTKFWLFKSPMKIHLKGIFLAVIFHGLYNTIIRFNWWWNLIPLGLLLLSVYLLIFKRIRKVSVISPQVPKQLL